MKTTLKAVKQATTKPSEAIIILQDSDRLAIAPVISLANELFDAERAHEKASIMLSEMRSKMADAFCTLMSDMNATYAQAQAYKKHLYETVASAQKVTLIHATKTLSLLIAASVKDGIYTNTAWTKSHKPSAKSMGEKREVLASLSDANLNTEIQASARAGNYKVAADLSKELVKREVAKASEIKRTEGKATTALKNSVKAFITGVSPEVLAAFVFTQHNIDIVLKLAKAG